MLTGAPHGRFPRSGPFHRGTDPRVEKRERFSCPTVSPPVRDAESSAVRGSLFVRADPPQYSSKLTVTLSGATSTLQPYSETYSVDWVGSPLSSKNRSTASVPSKVTVPWESMPINCG